MNLKDIAPFCVADASFFETPERIPDSDTRFSATERPAPNGWTRGSMGLYVSMLPHEPMLPDQGWKIHVSSTPSNAETVLEIVWAYCVGKGVAFKFLRSRAAVLMTSSKYWDRSASGKFITIYPVDDGEFAKVLEELAPRLKGFDGPYILSDLRYGQGPLFVRYGAFKPLWLTVDGGRVLAIRAPDRSLIADRREPFFTTPDFIRLPEIVQQFARNTSTQLSDFRYEFRHALHFSNGGGVYLARDCFTGDEVVIREARPYAGLDRHEQDAVARLLRERHALSHLDGLPCVPRLLDYCVIWEHHFLVVELVAGNTLLDEVIQRFPLVHRDADKEDLEDYVAWTEGVMRRMKSALKAIHDRGIRIGDIHPDNILISQDGQVTFVDFECAGNVNGDADVGLGAPGFTAPSGLAPREADYYALDRVHLMTLLPIVPLLGLDPIKAKTLCDAASANLNMQPGALGDLKLRLLSGYQAATPRDKASESFDTPSLDWPAIRTSLVAGILAMASPDRPDQLFPGDPLQFTLGSATLGYGAGGVLLALVRAGAEVPPELVEWFIGAASRSDCALGSGFYDGLHGVAYVLSLLGAHDTALKVLDQASSGLETTSMGLFSGRSGIALNLLHFGRLLEDRKMVSSALRLSEGIVSSLLSTSGPTFRGRAGLLSGAAGAALLCLHSYEETGDEQYLDAAESALRKDLSSGATLPDGTFHIRSGSRYLVYLDGGSIGIALVLARFLHHRDAEDLRAILDEVRLACLSPFVVHPGLFQGRAGMIAFLNQSPSSPDDQAAAAAHVRRLGWHATWHEGALAFPGNSLVRLSCDLATGSAGILLAGQSVFDGGPLGLPFL